MAAPPIQEVVFNRSPVTLGDSTRLQDGNDLNDALLDFFIKLGTEIICEEKKPSVYGLSSLFYQKLTGSGAKSGEDGWNNVKNWTKKIKPGLLSYPAIALPINETLIDPENKKNVMGQHWWLALVLNPANPAEEKQATVICVDSMKRRVTSFDPPHKQNKLHSLFTYSLDVTKIEQAAHRLWIYFDVSGDGSCGPLPDPRTSTLTIDQSTLAKPPSLALTINLNEPNQPGRYQGQLEFELDGRCKASLFHFTYSPGFGFPSIQLEFDAFSLSKMQKNVTRMTSGFLKKEWEKENRKIAYDKSKVRAAMVNAPQQENLYDCGVFVLENILILLQQGEDYLARIAADPTNVDIARWCGQAEVRHRRRRLVDCLSICFQEAATKKSSDISVLLKDSDFRQKVKDCLTDYPDAEEPPQKIARTE